MKIYCLLALCVFWTLPLVIQGQDMTWKVRQAFPQLSFEDPVDVKVIPGTSYLCVVEKEGRLQIFLNEPTATKTSLLLDISDRVLIQFNEMGLLGLAFDPEYEKNGFFYLNYTSGKPRRTVIARYQVDPQNPLKALKSSEKIILEISQPYVNHNGGCLAFGPDNYLYIGLGDGGSGGDPQNHGQNRRTWLGSLLRLDVKNLSPDQSYKIPPDNPFVNNKQGWKEEIYAWGLRNPWRFSFDPQTGELWAGDVGQNRFEEINLIKKGQNYGWNLKEGFSDFKDHGQQHHTSLPIHAYSRDEGISVTGGLVYRGTRFTELAGSYIYGDFGSGRLWALKKDPLSKFQNTLLTKTNLSISSFGVDHEGEILIVDFSGKLYRLQK